MLGLLLLFLLLWIGGRAAFLSSGRPSFCTRTNEYDDDDYHHHCFHRAALSNDAIRHLDTPDTIASVPEFHLLSLCYTPPDVSESGRPFSKTAADTWRWKDAVLGDGRDFFVPRPKTLQKLGSYLQEEVVTFYPNIEVQECMILSNCARFEIILAVTPAATTTTIDADQLSLAVSQCLVAQSNYYQIKVNGATKMMVASMDWPGVVASSAELTHNMASINNQALNLQPVWIHTANDLSAIVDHLSRVAVGIAPRPRRPDRTIQFRPFSSRDAHILLQLKRTVDAFSAMPQLTKLVQYALQAGKAARDVQRVPALSSLVPYGSGDSQKYSTQPPADLLQNVTIIVVETVIQPIVLECTSTFVAKRQAQVISRFRSHCEALAHTDEERQWIRRQLHEPTMDLRKGNGTAIVETLQQGFIRSLQEELKEQRQAVEPR